MTSWSTLLKGTADELWDYSISARFNQANIDTDGKTRSWVSSQIASKYQGTPAYFHSLVQSLHSYLGTQSLSCFPIRVDDCENTFVDTDDKMLSSFGSLCSPACKLLVFYNPNEYQYKQILSYIIAVIWLGDRIIITSFILGNDKEKDQQVSKFC